MLIFTTYHIHSTDIVSIQIHHHIVSGFITLILSCIFLFFSHFFMTRSSNHIPISIDNYSKWHGFTCVTLFDEKQIHFNSITEQKKEMKTTTQQWSDRPTDRSYKMLFMFILSFILLFILSFDSIHGVRICYFLVFFSFFQQLQ